MVLPASVWVPPICCGSLFAVQSRRLSRSVKRIRLRVSVKCASKSARKCASKSARKCGAIPTLNRLLNRNPYSGTLNRPAYTIPPVCTTTRCRGHPHKTRKRLINMVLPASVWVPPICCGSLFAVQSRRLSRSVKRIRLRVSVKCASKSARKCASKSARKCGAIPTLNRLLNRNPYSGTLNRPAYTIPPVCTTTRCRGHPHKTRKRHKYSPV